MSHRRRPCRTSQARTVTPVNALLATRPGGPGPSHIVAVDRLDNTTDAIQGVDDFFGRAQWLIDMAMTVLGLLAAVYMAVHRFWPELMLIIITFAVLLSSTNDLSIARSTLTIFPIFVLGGGILARRPEWVSTLVLTLSGSGWVWMVAITVLFTMTLWVG
jgi:hypothetical protein